MLKFSDLISIVDSFGLRGSSNDFSIFGFSTSLLGKIISDKELSLIFNK